MTIIQLTVGIFAAYMLTGGAVMTVLDVQTEGRLRAWGDEAPSKLLLGFIITCWPIVLLAAWYYSPDGR